MCVYLCVCMFMCVIHEYGASSRVLDRQPGTFQLHIHML